MDHSDDDMSYMKIVVIVMSPSMFSSSNGVYYVLIHLSMCFEFVYTTL